MANKVTDATCRTMFLKKCFKEGTNPVRELCKLGVESPLTKAFLRLGVSAHEDYVNKQGRSIAKRSSPFIESPEDTKRLAWSRNKRAKQQEAREVEGKALITKCFQNMQQILDEYALSKFDKWIINGTIKLGDATREQLLTAATKEEGLADGHQKNATFYRTLAARLPAGEQLRNSVNVSEVDAIRAQVFDGAAEMAA